jgi:oligopeptide transport system substrate-binding protein
MRATSSGFDTRGVRATQSRKPGKAGTLIALMGALTLILSACNIGVGGGASNTALAPDQTFTWPYVDKNATMGYNVVLDPPLNTTLKDAATISMIYTGLVTFTQGLGVRGDAATRWDVDSTGTIYTFHLRPNLKFSDGKPITAADFAYSIDRALDPHLCDVGSAKTYAPGGTCSPGGAPSQVYLAYILGAGDRYSGKISTMIANGDDARHGLNVIDPQTLRIRLSDPVGFFLESLTYSTSFVVEKSLIQKYPGGLWVDHLDEGGCSGPFEIKSYGDSRVMTLVPNHFWEQAFGQTLTIKQVVRPVISSEDAEYQAYRAGQYDYTDVPANDFAFAHGQADFHTVTSLETDYFGLNFAKPPFDNISVRQAFDLALNKQYIVDTVEKGGAVPTNHIVPQGMPGFNPGLLNPAPDRTQSLTGNQDAALSLLNKARGNCPAPGTLGAPDYCDYITGKSPLPIILYAHVDSQTNVDIANLAAASWSQTLGLTVQVKTVGFDQMVNNVIMPAAQNPMQIWEIGWIADYPDPQDWLTLQFATGSPYNSEGISISSLDKLMTSADSEQNLAKRMQMYNQAEQTVVDQVAWIPFQQGKRYWRQREFVRGFGFNSLGMMTDLNWPNVYIAAH